jgi:hypothetical protein
VEGGGVEGEVVTFPPAFEEATSPLHHSNDGRMEIRKTTNPIGFVVVDTTDQHVEAFTRKGEIADAFIAGYDYARRES